MHGDDFVTSGSREEAQGGSGQQSVLHFTKLTRSSFNHCSVIMFGYHQIFFQKKKISNFFLKIFVVPAAALAVLPPPEEKFHFYFLLKKKIFEFFPC